MTKPLCIYHGNCADGFAAAWVVRKYFNREVDLVAGYYGYPPPPGIEGRDLVLVDFSYKRPELEQMAAAARSILILDHHKTAAEDLEPFKMADHHLPVSGMKPWLPYSGCYALFDMGRSGAGLAWDYFFPDEKRPSLIDHIEDRDLWRFKLPGTRALHACLSSHPYDFEVWDWLIMRADEAGEDTVMEREGEAIHRKLLKDIGELLQVTTRRMVIGGVSVPVANLPSVMASEAGNIMAEGEPFAATYYEGPAGRMFSLRSNGAAGADVSEIAKRYGGGGHRNAAGFKVPIGWEGE